MQVEATVLTVDGGREECLIEKSQLMSWIRSKVGGSTGALDVVNLRDGRVMFVDDTGYNDGRPPNPEATKLYHSICRPGTTWQICGDVVVTLDRHFAD